MNSFETLREIILNRRSVKPALMNGKKIDKNIIERLLELADWAPTHGHTEPWRFIVYSEEKVQQFCNEHAELYKSITPADKFSTSTFEKLAHNGDKVSHIIAVVMQRGNNPKIPVLEEISAVSAAVQNILLAAETLGLAVLWSTGGLAHHPALKNYFGLREEDLVIGLLYMGYADDNNKQGTRIISLENKIYWK